MSVKVKFKIEPIFSDIFSFAKAKLFLCIDLFLSLDVGKGQI